MAYKIAAHAADIALGIPGTRDWDDDLTRARAALNWEKHFDLAFDGDTARAFHDEDMDVDTDFCAMCGHDWCSVRISKEIQEWASGKAEGFERGEARPKSRRASPRSRKRFSNSGATFRPKKSTSSPPRPRANWKKPARSTRRAKPAATAITSIPTKRENCKKTWCSSTRRKSTDYRNGIL